jgi:Relaxase/Mobilisation nuclease domain
MILKASQRGGSKQLALHLLNDRDNEHVEVHELRGFASDDLQSALHEIYAVSRGTRAKQFLFSLSMNPPPAERVDVETFEAAIDAAEKKLGLEGQPRAVVFHEKEGRRHAHVVWSRIDTERMRAINMAHFKSKLMDVSRALYLENGWQMPRGFVTSRERDPANYTLAEWQQAKRAKQNPQALKALFQECWAISDSKKAFASALQARGYTLARGDRRGHVAVDFRGEVYAIAKWTGQHAKDVRAKLGDEQDLPSVTQANAAIAARMTEMLRGHVAKLEAAQEKQAAAFAARRAHVIEQQRKERADLEAFHAARWARETLERASRLNHGVRGLWDRLTGKHGRQARENEREAWEAMKRDRREKDSLIERQLDERQSYSQRARMMKETHARDVAQLHGDIAEFMRTGKSVPENVKENAREEAGERTKRPRRAKKDRGPDREI